MKHKLLNKLWLRVGMIVAVMTTALAGTMKADTATTTFAAGSNYTAGMTLPCTSGGLNWVTSGKPNGFESSGDARGMQWTGINSDLTTTIPDATITEVKVVASTNQSNCSISAYVGNTQVGSSSSMNKNSKNITYTFSLTTGASGSIKVSLNNSNGSKSIWVKSITVTYTPAGSSAVATTTTIDASGITNTDLYDGTAAGFLTATVVDANDNTVTNPAIIWSSSNTSVATIAANGAVTLVGTGSTTFTATYDGVEDEYLESSDTYEMTVTNNAPATLPFEWAGGTSVNLLAETGVTAYNLGSDYAEVNNPYRVKFDNDGDYIQVKTDSRPGRVTIGVKMVGGSATSTITIQESANGSDFTDVQTLTISGAQNDVLTFKTNNAFAATSRYVRFYFTKGSGSNVGVGPISIAAYSTDPEIDAEDVEIAYDATSGSIAYEIFNSVTGGTLTTSTEADWLTLGTVGATVPFTCSANTTVSSRTATVTLTYTYGSESITKDVTVTQAGDPNALMTIAEVRAQGTGSVHTKGVVTSISGVTAYIQDASAAICVYGAELTVGDEIEVTGTLSTFNGLLEIGSPTVTVLSSSNSVEPEVMTVAQVNSNSSTKQGWLVKITGATVTTIDGQNVTLTQNESTITVRFNNAGDIDFEVDDIISLIGNIGCFNTTQIANPTDVVVVEIVTVTEAGYATYCSENALDFTGLAITAYVGTATNKKLTFTPITQVPANTGLLLVADGGATVGVPIIASAPAIASNCLTGVLVETTLDSDDYILNVVDGWAGFYKADAFKTLRAHRAYIPASYGAGVKGFVIELDDDATGIENLNVNDNLNEGAIYDLSGRKINGQSSMVNGQLPKGIYIVNGKKILK